MAQQNDSGIAWRVPPAVRGHLLQPSLPAIKAADRASKLVRARTNEIFDAIVTESPSHLPIELQEDNLLAALYRTCEGNLGILGDLLADTEQPVDSHIPDGTVNMGRVFARQHAPSQALVEIYRYGTNITYDALLDELLDEDLGKDELRQAILLTWNRLTAYVDAAVVGTLREYDDEWILARHPDAPRRLNIVRQLLSNTAISDTRELSIRLGYDLGRIHTGCVLEFRISVPPEERYTRSHRILTHAAQLLDGAALIIPIGGDETWGWIATPTPPASERLNDLGSLLAAHASTLSVGRPGRGPEGFRESQREANWAAKTARRTARSHPVTFYADVSAISMMTDAVQSNDFVLKELGSLASSDDEAIRLRQTIRVYFDSGMNAARAAAQLNTHKNTVTYRLRKAEARRGRPLGERRFELELALRLIDP